MESSNSVITTSYISAPYMKERLSGRKWIRSTPLQRCREWISNLTCSLAPECYYGRYVHPVCDVYSLAVVSISLFKSGWYYYSNEINGLCDTATFLKEVVNKGLRPSIPDSVPEGMLSESSC